MILFNNSFNKINKIIFLIIKQLKVVHNVLPFHLQYPKNIFFKIKKIIIHRTFMSYKLF